MEGKATRVGASKPGGERVSMELTGSATRLRRDYGAPGIEGKTTRVGASEREKRTSFNRGNGFSEIEGPEPDWHSAARAAALIG